MRYHQNEHELTNNYHNFIGGEVQEEMLYFSRIVFT